MPWLASGRDQISTATIWGVSGGLKPPASFHRLLFSSHISPSPFPAVLSSSGMWLSSSRWGCGYSRRLVRVSGGQVPVEAGLARLLIPSLLLTVPEESRV